MDGHRKKKKSLDFISFNIMDSLLWQVGASLVVTSWR